MKRRIFGIIFFSVLVLLGDRLGGWGLSKLVDRSQFRYSRLYQESAEAEILLLGNSRGLSFFQPAIEEVTGQSTFNLSYNGMPVDLMKILVEDYLERYPAPKTVLIDITLCDRFNEQLVAGFGPYRHYSERLDSLIKMSDAKVWWAGRVSHLFRYNSEVFQRALYYLGRSDEDWLLDRTITPGLIETLAAPDYTFVFGYPEETIAILNKLVKRLQQSGVQVRLVINPYFPSFRDKMIGLDRLKEQVEDITNQPVHDFSRAVEGLEYFGDFQHLNQNGSRVYIDLLEQKGFFNSENSVD